ncbi:hypothetical protein D0T50_02085 [Bacteroides sp. 214]|uniref:hypothetical protein n=1 Tax=Bacteroides sp. 214 TaxID=2302935 RepID=UPI0013D20413|nr:hypothetical protein [Bacteroides sp. 214]NDW11676.1 hypothetical protein [Bacteroides sp. 214]
MKKKHLSLLLTLALACSIDFAFGCSSAVISGKITPDGRPLLWKHRDTDFPQNSVKHFSGKKYNFIGIVNSVADNPNEVWIGTNSKGFSIMNTQSYNLVEIKPGEERGEANGRVMCLALEVCATVADFRIFLDTIAKPSLIEANFGVIDAQGGASMFEVDYYNYIEYDANNPKDAPFGYIARTNFSFAGKINDGGGYVRYMEVESKLMPAATTRELTPAWIFNELSRSFRHQLLGVDLRNGDFNRPKTNGWFIDNDFIPRKSTASSVVIQGVKKGENPDLTIMWTILGYPPVSVALPVWMKGAEKQLPTLLVRNGETKVAPLCDKVVTLAGRVFSYAQGMGSNRYFNWELLHNPAGTGMMQKLAPVEEKVFSFTVPQIEEWYKAGKLDLMQVSQLYQDLDVYIAESYNELFGL